MSAFLFAIGVRHFDSSFPRDHPTLRGMGPHMAPGARCASTKCRDGKSSIVPRLFFIQPLHIAANCGAIALTAWRWNWTQLR
jgi:hypothetical protein